MKINNNDQTSFQAKFLYSKSLEKTVKRAVEKGKFEKLNTARKNIDKTYLTRRLFVNIYENANGGTVVEFTRFKPKRQANGYYADKVVKVETDKHCNPYDFALKILVKLGNNAPNNNMYKKIVIDK